jgi:hypothetical protein
MFNDVYFITSAEFPAFIKVFSIMSIKFTRYIFIVLSFVIYNQSIQAQDDTQVWTSVFTNGSITKDSKALFWFDGHARFSEDASRLGVSIIRPGIGYKVSDRLSLWGGYARVVNRADGRADITENRIWQQATYTIASGDWGILSGRTRFEQRFLNTGSETGHRIRQFFRWRKPVSERWTATIWNETFIALNDPDFGARSGFDQNRLFLGMRWRAFENVSLEGGYLLNNIDRPVDNQANSNFSISVIAPF